MPSRVYSLAHEYEPVARAQVSAVADLPATPAQIREVFRRRLEAWGEMSRSRDSLVEAAYLSGLSKAEIARRTGMHRRTITLILSRKSATHV